MGALDGLKILEWADGVAGAYCGKLAADLGAEVIKVEAPRTGDKLRAVGPFYQDVPGPDRSGLFLYLNTNKLGVTLDPSVPEGRQLFLDLVSSVDVVVQEQPAALPDRLGVGYDTLAEANPAVVVVSVTPFGMTGPYRDYKATDLVLMQMGGPGYLQPGAEEAMADRPPVRPGGRQGDFGAGVSAAGAVMHGVFQQQATGRGCFIDVSALEAVAQSSNTLLGPYFGSGDVLRRTQPGTMPQPRDGRVPCIDGFLTLQPRTYQDWQVLSEMMGDPEWAQDEELQDAAIRAEYLTGKRPEFWEWTRTQKKQTLYHAAQRKRIVSFPVNSADDIVESEHLQARDYFVQVTTPGTGPVRQPGAPVKYSKTPATVRDPAPTLGQHNREVFGRLGITPEQLTALAESGIC